MKVNGALKQSEFDEILKVNDATLIRGYPKEEVRLLEEKDAENYYNNIYPDMIYSWQADGHADFREKFLGQHKSKKILDLGCANGNLVKSLVASNTVYGVDISKELVQKAQQGHLIAEICNLDKESLPYPDAFFDMVIGFDIFEHVFYPDKTVKEVFRVIKKGGLLKVSIPIKHANRHATMAHFLHKTAKSLDIKDDLASVVPDININTYEDTASLFSKNGFTLTHAEGWEWPWKKTTEDRARFLKEHPAQADDVFFEFIR